VLLVGDYPPPYGGLSVQVAALRERLAAMPDVECRVLDVGESRRQRRPDCMPVRGVPELVLRLATHAAQGFLVHLHTNGHNPRSWALSAACAAAGLLNGRRTIVSLGSGLAADYIGSACGPGRAAIRCIARATARVICRNAATRAALLRLGVGPSRVRVLPGFYGIPHDAALPALPEPLERFVAIHRPVLAALASDGPEYGISLVREAGRRLRARHPRLGVLLIGPGGPDAAALESGEAVTGPVPRDLALALMRRADLFVRPTYFDGDASSVREALALGVPVVASDTDFRPDGVALFRRGDVEGLTGAIARVLAEPRSRAGASVAAGGHAFGDLLEVYRGLAGAPPGVAAAEAARWTP
jgi:glycosyltransferase involved in cell wall biosynthesis